MGFFGGMSAINKINKLLKDLENQVTITQGQLESNAPTSNLRNSLNVHKRIHQDLIDTFGSSNLAMGAPYRVFGDKMNMDGILTYSKNLIYNLTAVISHR